MKIESVRIENFRSFRDVKIPFNDYTCLVGANGAGKSTALTALNIFFKESENVPTDVSSLDREDFHGKDTEKPVKITVTFVGLSDAAKEDFADYVRQEKLIISAEARYEEASGRAPVKQYGQRIGMTDFAEFFKAEGDKSPVSRLKEIYIGIKSKYSDLPNPGTRPVMIKCLRARTGIGC